MAIKLMSAAIVPALAILIAGTIAARAEESGSEKPAGIVGEIAGGNACAVENPAAFERRRQQGASSVMTLGDVSLTLYPRKPGEEAVEGDLPIEYIVIARKGACEHIIADANAFIVWARPEMPEGYSAAEPSPLAILSSYSGGAHCCTTLYALFPGKELKLQELTLGNGEAALTQDWAGGAPRLTFADDSFAYWNSSYAGSPGGGIRLDWSEAGYLLSDAMRGEAPTPAALTKLAQEIRTALLAFGGPYAPLDSAGAVPPAKGELDPIVWSGLLDLIYAGHADIAARVFDEAWPVEVKGKRDFWRDFVRQMEATWIWQPWELSKVLDGEMKFENGE